jgi:PTS system galactitol-specific IIA component
MQHTLLELLRAEHVLVDLDAGDSSSVIRLLNAVLVATGDTLPGYAEDAAVRERTFPTGLPTEPVAIAIPHAAPSNVLTSALAIATLHTPVVFAQMGTDGSVTLDVHAVFLLAIKESEKQVEMIAQLMQVIQSGSVLSGMMQATGAAGVVGLIRQIIEP